ncbi:prolactin regulatory element-binding protein-like [Varroa jacobsoni]|uniref:Prolactin regulatory element-binding protein n=2 Tax=Varroa destructor TaxID=109461 RepID=A0A7M7K7E1_VARDE|nr:prolactin regulatory element-binding protein-like isoform X1 [Varroa destructor]XP_022687659.1 prolactin regulatory element-binding protein-like [Varroa jacobsoni]
MVPAVNSSSGAKSKDKSKLIGRVNFPLCTIDVVSERHVFVAGGGGRAKTGVPNKMEILEIVPEDAGGFRAETVASYDVGDVIMCSALCPIKDSRHLFLAVGKGGVCDLYRLSYTLQKQNNATRNGTVLNHASTNKIGDGGVRQRHVVQMAHQTKNLGNLGGQGDHNPAKDPSGCVGIGNGATKLGFEIRAESSFQSDFNDKEDPFQRVVRFAPKKGILLTGGSDGYLRAWKSPAFTKQFEVKAHDGDIDDITISIGEESVVSIGKDGRAIVWSFQGEKVMDLTAKLPVEDKYGFRNARFGGIAEGNSGECRLFATINPMMRRRPLKASYIVKWNPHKAFSTELLKVAGADLFSAMAISDDGIFLATGRQSGCVEIFIAFSLERLYVCEKAHNVFVTGMAFLKSAGETCRLTQSDATLVSISVDNLLKAHCIPPQSSMGVLGMICFFICFMVLVYIVLDLFGL